MKRLTRFLFIFALLSPVFFFATQSIVHAAGANQNVLDKQKQFEKEASKKAKSNLNKTAQEFFDANLSTYLNSIAGCFSTDKTECPNEEADAGAIGGVGKMIAFTYNPPASVETYVADVMKNMNIAQPAYAQGLGFSALQPILELWKVFRNISYVFFVFIFLVIGFGIMFRKNLGGQTAVTVQQALPRIIMALLAVSFSYAIAGLMIDLMWVVMFFLIAMFGSAHLITVEFLNNQAILNQNIFEVFISILTRGEIANRAGVVVGSFVRDALQFQGIFDAVEGVISGISSVLTTLIIFVAIIFAMFRTFFSLIKVYLEIILSIIFAPIILMMGAINGNAFGNWLKGLVANLAVFPVLLVFMIIGFMLVDFHGSGDLSNSLSGQLGTNGFVPPFIPGRTNPNSVGLIGGIAAILLLPEVVNIVGKFKPKSIFEEYATSAWKNAMAGKGVGLPAGAALIGGGLGGAAGAVYGANQARNTLQAGGSLRQAGSSFLSGAGMGALIGGVGGVGTAQGIPLKMARGLGGTVAQQAQDIVLQDTIKRGLRDIADKQGLSNDEKRAKLNQDVKTDVTGAARDTKDTLPSSTSDESTL